MLEFGCNTMVGTIKKVLVKKPQPFMSKVSFKKWNYKGPLKQNLINSNYNSFLKLLKKFNTEIIELDLQNENQELCDSIFTHDPSLVTNKGAIILNMGKKIRKNETKEHKIFYKKINIPIIGEIREHGTVEGGDCVWLKENTLLVGKSYRTNQDGINQLSNICQNIPGANIDDIAKTIGLDPRIGKLFLNAGPGYGGSCLPKDMKALINFANNVGINPTLLNAVEEINIKQIDQIISLIKQKLGDISSKRITILGTAFKSDTDDIRDSVAIKLIKKLLKRKAKIIIHDPKAIQNTMNIFGKRISYAKSINDALSKSQCVVIMTQWKQYENLNNNQIKQMTKKFIIDCRRMLVKKELDGDYFAIGLGKQN